MRPTNSFPEAVGGAIAAERCRPADPQVHERMEILWLESRCGTHERIAVFAGISRSTVQRTLRIYAAKSLVGIRSFGGKGQPRVDATQDDDRSGVPRASAAHGRRNRGRLGGGVAPQDRGWGPVTWVMDNARCPRGAWVQGAVKELGIELLFLPSYSPAMNPVERLGKFVKKEGWYRRPHQDFKRFRGAREGGLADLPTKYREERAALMTHCFKCGTTCHSRMREA